MVVFFNVMLVLIFVVVVVVVLILVLDSLVPAPHMKNMGYEV